MKRQNALPLLSMSIAIVALLVLALGLSRLVLSPGRPFPLWDDILSWLLPRPWAAPTGSGQYTSLRVPIAIIFWSLVAFTIVCFIVSREMRRLILRRMLVGIILFLILYQLVSYVRNNPPAPPEPLPPGAESQLPQTEQTPAVAVPDFVTNPSPWLIAAVTVVMAGGLAAGIWFFWRRTPNQASPLELLALEAEAALADLSSGGDLQQTVQRCYREMSRVIQEQRGIQRDKTMTPREFERHLAAVGLGDEHIHRLTQLFERVRYGGAHASEREEREAAACLRAIVQAYGGAR